MSAKAVRLDKLLANLGYGSRREIQGLARAGAIRLDGAEWADAGDRIALEPDLPERLLIDGTPLDPLPGLCLMLHKPLGVTCSHKEAGPLVYGLCRSAGAAATRRSPQWAVSTRRPLACCSSPTTARCCTDHQPESQCGEALPRDPRPAADRERGRGVRLGHADAGGRGSPLLPVPLVVEDVTHCSVTLTEGRYHQVRRMFAAVGNHVVALHRDRIGGLDLPRIWGRGLPRDDRRRDGRDLRRRVIRAAPLREALLPTLPSAKRPPIPHAEPASCLNEAFPSGGRPNASGGCIPPRRIQPRVHRHGRRFLYASAPRSGRPFRSPVAPLEPEDAAVHLRHAQQYPHHRSRPDRAGAAPGAAA